MAKWLRRTLRPARRACRELPSAEAIARARRRMEAQLELSTRRRLAA